MLKDHEVLLSQLSERWHVLEGRIKRAEQITGYVIIPAINELRYCGRRFLDAWRIAALSEITAEQTAEFHTHIRVAEQYFNNADHDLTDGLVAFFSERKVSILGKGGSSNAILTYPKLTEWIGQIHAAQALIRQSRHERTLRMENYAKIQDEILPNIINNYDEINVSELAYIRRTRFRRYRHGAERVLGILGVLFGFLTVWSHWDHTRSQIANIFPFVSSSAQSAEPSH